MILGMAAAVKKQTTFSPMTLKVIGVLVTALVTYFTMVNALDVRLAGVSTRQEDQFNEIQRELADLKVDIYELRHRIEK